MGQRHRVVVVGGGFGGLACARALDGKPVDVVLLDRRNHHLFTPLLYQVATALLNPSDIAYPLRSAFRRSGNVRFRLGVVTGVDLDARVVRTHDDGEIPYDSLVLATGSTNAYFGNPDLARYTIGMKTLDEALRLRNHVLSCLERAAQADPAERGPWLTFVIVGGGPTGVEYAGALAELLGLVLGRDYPELEPGSGRIVLVEGAGHLLPAFDRRLGSYAQRVLARRGVEVRTGTLVTAATDQQVQLRLSGDTPDPGGETVPARTVVWSAGVQPADPLPGEGPPRSRSRRLQADARLRLGGRDEVFVIGDLASVPEDPGVRGVPEEAAELPMLAPPAMQEGRHAARAVLARAGVPGATDPGPFRYRDKGTMATIGRNAAVVELGRLRLTGFAGWVTWLVVHLWYIIGFRNRAVVLASWAWDYLRRDRPIRVIIRSADDPVAAQLHGRR
ncbi:MAG: NAD(P)/FAD-dependent oxidoreductase [Actinomycetota bacterium]|nr:NAD(P)/FAD-dependent oxidoreductase [Actinomycetota bacterium]